MSQLNFFFFCCLLDQSKNKKYIYTHFKYHGSQIF